MSNYPYRVSVAPVSEVLVKSFMLVGLEGIFTPPR